MTATKNLGFLTPPPPLVIKFSNKKIFRCMSFHIDTEPSSSLIWMSFMNDPKQN